MPFAKLDKTAIIKYMKARLQSINYYFIIRYHISNLPEYLKFKQLSQLVFSS